MSVLEASGSIVRVYRIGEVARIVGVTTEAIRLAERERRIPPARREGFGSDDRVYTDAEVARLHAYFRRGTSNP